MTSGYLAELAGDADGSAVTVNVGALEPGQLAPPQTAGCRVRERHKYWLRRDLLRKRGIDVSAAAGTQTPAARRLTVLAIASESWTIVFYVLWAARAVQRRRPRMVAGYALVLAGSVARLRAASAEPLR